MVERDCYWGEDRRRRGRLAFGMPLHPLGLGSAPPGVGFCSLLSSPLPLQQLWLAWRVFKLIQLSGGLFLVQSALDLAAVQRALLSCCPGCCWFGEARASPWLCPHSHPLLQPAHRTVPALLLCLPCRTIFIPLSMNNYQRAHWRAHRGCHRTLASLQAAAASPSAFCPTRAVRQSDGCPFRERRDGGNHALQCPMLKDRGVRPLQRPRWADAAMMRSGPGSPKPPCATVSTAGRGWQRPGWSCSPQGVARTPAPSTRPGWEREWIGTGTSGICPPPSPGPRILQISPLSQPLAVYK